MAAFHQLGHDSENLLFEPSLSGFSGAILSPLNYAPADVRHQLTRLKERKGFVTIFDPHLYRPQSERASLPAWSYYPKDVESADFTAAWWAGVVDAVAETAVDLTPTLVASPAIVPKTFSDDFYQELVANGDRLAAALRGTSVNPIQTVVVNLPELATPGRVMAIASIVSKSRIPDCLLVIVCNVEPRRELMDPEEIKGAMLLIGTLEAGGQHVTVSFSSSDMLLWKAAGATNCATGKFFNLRRFTISRFEEPNGGGGGQLGYWFEESLLAFLRQSDLLRVQAKALVSDTSRGNPFSAAILESIPEKKPWLAFSWRFFMYWFADAERRIDQGAISAEELVSAADVNWGNIEQAKPPVIMEERANDGAWVRQWRRALAEYPYILA